MISNLKKNIDMKSKWLKKKNFHMNNIIFSGCKK